MFTGLIEAVGKIEAQKKRENGLSLSIAAAFSKDLNLGESVAVNGVCLTVTQYDEKTFDVDVIPESLRCTSLSQLKAGDPVNLERALKVGDRLGGHFVQGHVDGVGTVKQIARDDSGWRIRVEPPAGLQKYIAPKGSITIQGVSLTVSTVSENDFEVALIPHTLENTTLGELQEGDPVNLEVDVLARYLEQLNLK